MASNFVTLEVNARDFGNWEALTITRSLETCADAFSLTAPFDSTNRQVRTAFKPFGYQRAILKIDGEEILTGTVEQSAPSLETADNKINIQGRSLTGPLIDCSIDGVGYNFKGLTLESIAKKLCSPFGLQVISGADGKKVLSEAMAEPGQGPFDFLNRLCQDLGLLLTCNEQGNLVITKIIPGGQPVASIIEGQTGLMSINTSFNGSERFSSYKILQQQDGANNLKGRALDSSVWVYRPKVETGSDANSKDIKTGANWKRALALAASVNVSLMVSEWRGPSGKIWAPGDVITLKAPSVYITNESPFIVKDCTLTLDASNGRTTALNLVLPATYTGELPEVYPWD